MGIIKFSKPKPVFKIKIWDESGQPVFKSKGKRRKVHQELDEYFNFK